MFSFQFTGVFFNRKMRCNEDDGKRQVDGMMGSTRLGKQTSCQKSTISDCFYMYVHVFTRKDCDFPWLCWFTSGYSANKLLVDKFGSPRVMMNIIEIH